MITKYQIKHGKVQPIWKWLENPTLPIRRCQGATMGKPDVAIPLGIDNADLRWCPEDGYTRSLTDCDKACGREQSIRCRLSPTSIKLNLANEVIAIGA